MDEPKFTIGDIVIRKSENLTAIILDVLEDIDGFYYLIEYAEGGTGYWTENSLVLFNV